LLNSRGAYVASHAGIVYALLTSTRRLLWSQSVAAKCHHPPPNSPSPRPDWTQASPTHSPAPRYDTGMAYDAATGQVVLFGGGHNNYPGDHWGDTWTWDGSDWTQRPSGSIKRNVHAGPPGTLVTVQGWGFLANESLRIVFVDSVNGTTVLRKRTTDASGGFKARVEVPAGATLGVQHLKVMGETSGQIAKRPFTVT
jgi:hypothetical protein